MTSLALVCEQLSEDFSGVNLLEVNQSTLSSLQPIQSSQPAELLTGSLVKVKPIAVALNWPDCLMTQGAYQFKPPVPFVIGMEGAGIVQVAPSSSKYKVGDAVIFGQKFGALATSISVPEHALQTKPPALTFKQAAGFSTVFLTAWASLVEKAKVQSNEWVLIHGASGGVGSASVILAKHLGAKVIATVTTPTKLDFVKSLGADHVIDISADKLEKMPQTVKALTDNKGVNIVIDPLGGEVLAKSIRSVQWGARLVIVGFTSGDFTSIPSNHLLIKGLCVMGVRAGEMGRKDPETAERMRQAIMKLPEQGCIPVLGHSYSLAQAKQALLSLQDRQTLGKTIVEIDPSL